MAIDYNAGINSIDVGAHDITYSDNEGPKSPEQEKLMGFDDTPGFELEPLEKLLDEYREDNNGRDPVSIDDLRRFFYTKYGPKGIAKVEQAVQQQEQQAQMQQRGGIQMASAADPMLQEEYDKYVFEMQEIGQEPMSLEQFRQEAVAGMATGGRAGYASGQLVKPGPGRPGYKGDDYEYGGVYSSPSSSKSYDRGPVGGPADWGQQAAAEKAAVGKAPKHYNPETNPYSAQNLGVSGGEGSDDHKKELAKLSAASSSGVTPQEIKDIKDSEQFEIQQEKTKKQNRRRQEKLLFDQRYKKANFLEAGLYSRFPNDPTRELAYLKELQAAGHYIPDELLDLITAADEAARKGEDYKTKLTVDEFGMLSALQPQGSLDFRNQSLLGMTDPYTGEEISGSPHLYARGDLANFYSMGAPDWWDPEVHGKWEQHRDKIVTSKGLPTGSDNQDDPYALVNRGYPGGGTLPPTTDPTPDPDIPTGPIEDGLGGINPAHQAILKNIYGGTLPAMFAADGGRAGYAGGGIADLRQGYFLGKIVKSITKPFKGITRGIKKFAKSPAGKMAIAAALMGYPFGGGANAKWFGQGSGWGKLSGGLPSIKSLFTGGENSTWSKMLGSMKDKPFPWIAGASALGGLYTAMDDEDEDEMYKKWLADKAAADAYWIPRFDQSNFRRITSADGGRIGYAEGGDKGRLFVDEDTTVPLTEFEKDLRWTDKDTRSDMYYELLRKLEGMSDEEKREFLHYGPQPYGSGWGEMVRALEYTDDPVSEDYYEKGEHYAQGGRTGYAGGGYNDDDEEEDNRVAALRAMYGMRRNAQEGGLMDLGGMEKDYRNEGGFVPIGGQERADDVPARLSKNEFVFTADAVRNAGGGDIDKGAEIMENLMENLEQGGKVSEESQGLEGARDMFATSQRLEGVL